MPATQLTGTGLTGVWEVNVLERSASSATATAPSYVGSSVTTINAAEAKALGHAAHIYAQGLLDTTNYAKVQRIVVTVELKG